jgi:hypothetical protein
LEYNEGFGTQKRGKNTIPSAAISKLGNVKYHLNLFSITGEKHFK